MLGWSITIMPNAYLEAEFHAVWRNPSGKLVDLTPIQSGPGINIADRLFLVDHSLQYAGCQIANKYWPLSTHTALPELFRAYKDRFDLINEGALKYQHGKVPVDPVRLHQIEARILTNQIALLENGVLQPPPGKLQASAVPKQNRVHGRKVGRNEKCPCGSGKKFKKCCGQFT